MPSIGEKDQNLISPKSKRITFSESRVLILNNGSTHMATIEQQIQTKIQTNMRNRSRVGFVCRAIDLYKYERFQTPTPTSGTRQHKNNSSIDYICRASRRRTRRRRRLLSEHSTQTHITTQRHLKPLKRWISEMCVKKKQPAAPCLLGNQACWTNIYVLHKFPSLSPPRTLCQTSPPSTPWMTFRPQVFILFRFLDPRSANLLDVLAILFPLSWGLI